MCQKTVLPQRQYKKAKIIILRINGYFLLQFSWSAIYLSVMRHPCRTPSILQKKFYNRILSHL